MPNRRYSVCLEFEVLVTFLLPKLLQNYVQRVRATRQSWQNSDLTWLWDMICLYKTIKTHVILQHVPSILHPHSQRSHAQFSGAEAPWRWSCLWVATWWQRWIPSTVAAWKRSTWWSLEVLFRMYFQRNQGQKHESVLRGWRQRRNAWDRLLSCCWDSDGWWLTPRWLPVLLELLGRRWSRRNEIPGRWWQLFSMNLLRTRSKVKRQQKLLSLESFRKIGSQSYFIDLITSSYPVLRAVMALSLRFLFSFSVSRRTRIFVRMPCGEILPADLDLDWTTTQASEYIIATWHRLESLAAKFRGKGILPVLPVIAAFLFITFSTSE